MYCDKLEVITVPQESEILTVQDGVLYNKSMTELLYYPTGKKDETYTIPNGVKTIGGNSFHGNSYLKKVTMPDTVTYIGYWAFFNDSALQEINISANCKIIGQYAFSGTAIETLELPASLDDFLVWYMYMGNLKSITVDKDNLVYSSHEGVLYNKNKTSLIYCPSAKEDDYIIPDSVTYIEERAFSSHSLSSVTIPWSAAIGVDNFLENRNPLVIYGYNGSAAQRYVQDYSDYNIEFVSIGEMPVLEVASGTCGKHLKWRLDNRGVLTISGKGKMTSAPWQEKYRNRITEIIVEEGVESFGGWGPYCSLSTITLPSSLKVIEDHAFDQCSRLSDFIIPDGIIEIGSHAFSKCGNLTNIFIPASVEKIGDGAFYQCDRLKEITVDSGNWNYSSLEGVLFNFNQTELIQYPDGKENYDTYIIPAGVQHIGDGAFSSSRFNMIVIPDSVVDIKDSAFYQSSVKNIFIGEGTVNIERLAFCSSSLREIFIGSNVSQIGFRAFDGLYSLETIYYFSSKEDWDKIDIDDYNDDIYRADIIYDKEIVSFNTEHKLEVVSSKAPTCLESGNIYYFKCADCGKCYSDPIGTNELTEEQIFAPARGHKIRKVEAKEATCTEEGNILHYSCMLCGEYYSDGEGINELTEEQILIPAKGHNLSKTEAQNATCTENGNIAYYSCDLCGKYYADKKGVTELTRKQLLIPAKHSFSKWKVTIQPDYKKKGKKQRKCSACGKTETKMIAKRKIKVGSEFTADKMNYRVTKLKGKKTVALIGTDKTNKNLSKLKVKDSVKFMNASYQITSIDDRAFKGYRKLTKVTIGKNVKTIGREAFCSCKRLSTFEIASKKLTSLGKNAIKGIKNKAKIKVPSKKLNSYKKIIKKGTGYKKTMKIVGM